MIFINHKSDDLILLNDLLRYSLNNGHKYMDQNLLFLVINFGIILNSSDVMT